MQKILTLIRRSVKLHLTEITSIVKVLQQEADLKDLIELQALGQDAPVEDSSRTGNSSTGIEVTLMMENKELNTLMIESSVEE